MDEYVREALDFNEEVGRKSKSTAKTVLHALFAVVIAGAYFVMSQWAGVIPTWVFIAFMIAMLGLLFWVGIYQEMFVPAIVRTRLRSQSRIRNFMAACLYVYPRYSFVLSSKGT